MTVEATTCVPAKTPRGRRGPQLDLNWRERFLNALRDPKHGGARWKAARLAGVSIRTVENHEREDSAFAGDITDAIQEYADECVVGLKRIGDERHNPLAYFGLLRALRPNEWNDRVVSVNLNVDVDVNASAGEAKAMLAQALGHLTPATMRELTSAQQHAQDSRTLVGSGTVDTLNVAPTAAGARAAARGSGEPRESVTSAAKASARARRDSTTT